MFFIPVKYKKGKKQEIIVMSVELLYGKRFLEDEIFAQKYAQERVQHILGKAVDEVSFPMGMRPWKVNTMLSLDGFRICITGSGSGGKCLLAQPVMQFSTDEYWKYYIGKIEKFVEKVKNNTNYIYDETYDVVSVEDNIRLYDLYIDKLQNSIYQKRINPPYFSV
jgi:CRISPR-associated endonuclease Csn1